MQERLATSPKNGILYIAQIINIKGVPAFMKNALLAFIPLILLSSGLMKEKSINGKWNVKEVTYLKAGKIFGEDFTQGYYFFFDKESFFKTNNSLGSYDGKWKRTGDTLALATDEKIDHMMIHYQSKDSLVLSINVKKETLMFSLKKERKSLFH